jgi:uncharacterized protein (TIGR00369 family)
LERQSPFGSFLSPQVIDLSPGKIKMRIPFRKEFIGNISVPCIHGGAVSAIIDHCGGNCAWSGLNDITNTVSTVDIRVDYLRPA